VLASLEERRSWSGRLIYLVYHSTLGLRVTKKEEPLTPNPEWQLAAAEVHERQQEAMDQTLQARTHTPLTLNPKTQNPQTLTTTAFYLAPIYCLERWTPCLSRRDQQSIVVLANDKNRGYRTRRKC